MTNHDITQGHNITHITQECPRCQTPVRAHKLVGFISFPDQVETLLELFEGRLNFVTCPVCGHNVSFGAMLAVVRKKGKSTQCILAAPQAWMSDLESALLTHVKQPYSLDKCEGYGELILKMIPWIDEETLQPLQEIINRTLWTRPRDERISMLSPLLLALLQAQVNDTLLFSVVQMSSDPSRAREVLGDILAATIHDQAKNLVLVAAEEGTMSSILSTIRTHIPPSTLTAQLLEYSIDQCESSAGEARSSVDRDNLAIAYRNEFVNAALHDYADKPNPRSLAWAELLRAYWVLSKHPRASVDPRFFLTPEIIRATTRFEDLWDVSLHHREYSSESELLSEFDDVTNMLQRFGFQRELEGALSAGAINFLSGAEHLQESEQAELIDVVRGEMLASVAFNKSVDESVDVGHTVGYTMEQVLMSFPASAAEALLRPLLRDALETQDLVAAASLVAYGIEALNNVQAYERAARLVDVIERWLEHPEFLAEVDRAGPSLWLRIYIELGNVYRYTNQSSRALDAYDRAEYYLAAATDGDRNNSNLATLLTNRAMVLRGLGQYRKALSLLDEAVAITPDRSDIYHSKAVLYLMIGDLEAALDAIDTAMRLLNRADRDEHGRYLVTRAQIREVHGDEDSALIDVKAALELFRPASEYLRLAAASLAVKISSSESGHQSFLHECEERLRKALPGMLDAGQLELAVQTVHALISRRLDLGEYHAADQEFGSYLSELDRLSEEHNVGLSWYFSYIRGRLEYALGRYDNVWPYLAEALGKANEDVPLGEDITFSVPWMQSTEKFQSKLGSLALDLYSRHLIPASELLRVYEFNNGREISARLNAVDALDIAPIELLDRLSRLSNTKDVRVHLLYCIDAETELAFGYYSTDSSNLLVLSDLRVDISRLRHLRDRMRDDLKYANPADLTWLEDTWNEWDDFWHALGSKLESLVGEGDHICILPGRMCTGLPLHLIRCPDGLTLIEKYSVSYAPNLATLLDVRVRAVPSHGNLLVAVSKQTDTEVFRANLAKTVASLSSVLGGSENVRILQEKEASPESTCKEIVNCSEAVFLTHGSYGGPQRGFGICLSDGEYLPPGLLPVEDVPELERFLLTWDDLEELSHTPSLVVSIACSSGQTTVSRGGVRFGLEQSMFASGTRVILSPLWDVEQNAVLAWVSKLYDLKSSKPPAHFARTFQQCCLDMKSEFAHPYFWGAFVFNGSLKEALNEHAG
jgi:tetratricopeptide (TPR) repeat protein